MKKMIMISHLLISFFYKYIGADYPITQGVVDNFDALQYYFFTNFLDFKYLFDVQIFLRFVLKMEYLYTDYILPLELTYLHQQAEKLEETRKNQLDDMSKK